MVELRSVIDLALQQSKQTVETHIANSTKAIPELIENELQTSLASIRKDLDASLDGLKGKVDANAMTVRDGLEQINYELREQEHKSWVEKNVMTNALRTAQQMLKVPCGFAIAIGWQRSF